MIRCLESFRVGFCHFTVSNCGNMKVKQIKAKFMPLHFRETSAYRISIRNYRKYEQKNGKQT